MDLIIHILQFILVSPYLFKSKHHKRTLISLLVSYMRLYITLLIISPLSKGHSVKLSGYKVEYTNPSTLLSLYEEIFLKNIYYFESKNETPLIIDAGSNIGMSVLYFKWLFPKAHIIAFEPYPLAYNLLVQNISNNQLENITTYNIALSDVKKEIPFYTNPNEKADLRMSIHKYSPNNKEITVQADLLSKYTKPLKIIDILKLDIEGSETQVIKEIIKSNQISKFREMLIEYHHNQNQKYKPLNGFIKMIEDTGFTVQIDARSLPIYSKKYQDIRMYCSNSRDKSL